MLRYNEQVYDRNLSKIEGDTYDLQNKEDFSCFFSKFIYRGESVSRRIHVEKNIIGVTCR